MDAARLKILEAEIQAQLDEIEQVYGELENRVTQMHSAAPAQIESVAYQLHNLYTAIEDLLKIVASAFENSVADLSRWHTELLHRMTLEIQGIRPALISEKTGELLNELRAFRHLFRHAYGRRLDFNRVKENLAIARQLRPLLPKDVDTFLRSLQSSTKEEAL